MRKIIPILSAIIAVLSITSCQNKLKDSDGTYEAFIPALEVSNSFVEFSESERQKTFTVSSNTFWRASSVNDWITLSPSEGRGNGEVRISLKSNTTTAARTGSIVVSNGVDKVEIAVTQATSPFVPPTVSVVQVETINKSTARCTFTFQSADFVVSSYGICYSSTEEEPSIDNAQSTKLSDRNGGTVTFVVEGLTPKTTYYVRAYATTTRGIVYGDITSFTTPQANAPGDKDNPLPNY